LEKGGVHEPWRKNSDSRKREKKGSILKVKKSWRASKEKLGEGTGGGKGSESKNPNQRSRERLHPGKTEVKKKKKKKRSPLPRGRGANREKPEKVEEAV